MQQQRQNAREEVRKHDWNERSKRQESLQQLRARRGHTGQVQQSKNEAEKMCRDDETEAQRTALD
ncbi:hypothetical protein [Massilia pseudoviolaceinigra]|uniref:hypothetical protein n=1 Tax=Massilia pseudoviolaceinigra TaxID=3057165 RepID=UPI002796CE73|nr:hypothetical protein [Massilia sp. CCM 9206]MDQ1924358.1 hypothetical protein [Massilia sp. CCM 9206]